MTLGSTLPSRSRRALRRALAALRGGSPEAAERLLAQLVNDEPRHAPAWHYRAIAAHQNRQPGLAEECFERAALLEPGRADFALDYARFLLERGRAGEALTQIEKTPPDLEHAQRAVLLSAETLVALGRPHDAVAALQTYLESRGEAPAVRRRRADLLEEFGWEEAARETLAEGLRLSPEDPEYGPLLAAAWRAGGHHDRATELSRRLAGSAASPAAAWLDLAIVAAQAGDTRQAVAHATEALNRDPTLHEAWLLLAELSDLSAEAFCERLPATPSRHTEFARARILDRHGRYEAAWAAYLEGNRLASLEQGLYSSEQQEEYVESIVRHLGADFLARSPGADGPREATPVFICAVPRSGTTLLEQMLAAHPSGAVRAGGELRTLHRLLRRGLVPRSLAETGRYLAGLSDGDLEALVTEWRLKVHEHAGGAAYVIDKMPTNFFLLGLLHVAFPQAPIVLLERDPVALACSCFTTAFAEGHAFSHSLEAIVHYFRQFRRVHAHWEATLPTGRVLHMRYEELLRDPGRATSEVLARMGLSWSEEMLAFHRRRQPVHTASLLQVREPLNRRANERWRRFEPWLAPWQKGLEEAYRQGR